MDTPRVNPVGVVEVPQGYVRTPRRYGKALRMLAIAVLAIFVGAVVATTVASLASYCLTTWAGAPPPAALP